MLIRWFATLAAAGLLAACAVHTKLIDTWVDSDYRGPAFKRVLVVGFGEDGAMRRIFEEEFARTLRASGVEAVVSFELSSGVSEVDLDKVKEMVRRSRADGVLTTRVIGIDRRVSYAPAEVVVMPPAGYRRGFYGYYSSAVLVNSTTTAFNYDVVKLETNLWQVAGEHLVWSGVTEIFAPENARSASAGFARVIVDALRAQRMI